MWTVRRCGHNEILHWPRKEPGKARLECDYRRIALLQVPHLKSSIQQQDVLMKDLENQARDRAGHRVDIDIWIQISLDGKAWIEAVMHRRAFLMCDYADRCPR